MNPNTTAEIAPAVNPPDAKSAPLWRSLDELNSGASNWNEFPPGASEWPSDVSRRGFLKLMSASLAMAGAAGCTREPIHKIVSYVRQPEELNLGNPLYYATAMPLAGFGTGMLVKSREGRPIKADGNPDHPASLGGSNVWMQASLLDLYDPDRAKAVLANGDISTWADFLGGMRVALDNEAKKEGAGLRILTGTVTSPSLAAQITALLQKYPRAKWHQYEVANSDSEIQGAILAFGEPVATHHHFNRANVIVSLDADFLYNHPSSLRYSRQFTNGRRVAAGETNMNRLYVVESTPTITGAMAEHRWALNSFEVSLVASDLLALIRGENPGAPHYKWLSAIAKDCKENTGECIVITGVHQSAEVHALVHQINHELGNIGKTITYTQRAEANPVIQTDSIRDLASDLNTGSVSLLLIIGGNPVYDAPSDLLFGEALKRCPLVVHLTESPNETSQYAHWLVPKTHLLESWSDIRSYDGTISIMQPLIAPLFDGRSEHEVLNALLAPGSSDGSYEIVRSFWAKQKAWDDFETGWRTALNSGLIANSQLPPKQVTLKVIPDNPPNAAPNRMELTFRLDPHVWDGRFLNNPWLLELPKPISKLTWDNAILISPALASKENLKDGDVIAIKSNQTSITGPVLISPGQSDYTLTVHLGWGRAVCGSTGKEKGFNAYLLRSSYALWTLTDFTILKTGRHHLLASMQKHQNIPVKEREVYREAILADWLLNPDIIKSTIKQPGIDETLYAPSQHPYNGRKWGMAIDLTTCIGCNACVMACNIENNIPVVGKEQVNKGREMLWIRIDTYFSGNDRHPGIKFQPVPCMHCENAPCEYVCPVDATVHDHEGLNLQVYNRCIGTRYCSNNCPYKVRRFNFLQYSKDTPLTALRNNPEVSVRTRGVMEKCTYCVQRIRLGSIRAREENRGIKDGEIKTACQEACPTEAIIFGDLNDPDSRVNTYKRNPLTFGMLAELNTHPRTTYSARLTNPNPQLTGAEGGVPA
jgi:molybdopterin-containing oxidoreductase family iron-sulfur binding subunit